MPTVRSLAAAALLGVLAPLALAAAAPAMAQDAADRRIVVLRLDGVVDPFIASYVKDEVAEAQDGGAAAILLTIDTPGGLDSSMRQIVQAILASDVPVICYVSPDGARAASAGTFVLLSCPVAAMAPATNAGAAHPVGLSGAIASEKATNDAAEFIVSLAERHGRNAEWAERAVRDSISASAEESLDLGVIDLVAGSTPDLLDAVDGSTVSVAEGREVTLDLGGAVLEDRSLGWGPGLLHDLLDPNLAFLFLYLGLALVIAELFVPGLVLGITGGVMLILAVVALGMLPVEIVGVVAILASLAFFALELKHPGLGLPTVAGITALVLGGLFLFDPSVPSARVSPFVIAPVALFAAGFFGIAVQAAIRMRRRPAMSSPGAQALGRIGVVVRPVDPLGIVRVSAEEWTAESLRGPIPAGESVRVVSMRGLRLIVEPVVVEAGAQAAPGGSVVGPSGAERTKEDLG
jgi:membrane-bound serine protease (ClpP class)